MKQFNKEEYPQNLTELCDWIEQFSWDIYVREKVNDKWKSVSLGELPGNLAVKHVLRFIREGRVPTRIVRE